jgi:hypothetical protein
VSQKAADLGSKVLDLADEGAPFGNTVDKMMDNMAAALMLIKQTTLNSGRLVRAMGIPLDPATGTMNLFVKDDAGEDGFEAIQKIIRGIQDNVKAGDLDEARQDLLAVAAMLKSSDGRPEKILAFGKLAMQIGIKDAGSMMINSIFSGPRTQGLNIVGNAYNTVERPMSSMIQGVFGRDEHAMRAAGAGLGAG